MRTLTKTGLVIVETLEGTSKATPDKQVLDDEERVRMWPLASAMRTGSSGLCKSTSILTGTYKTRGDRHEP